MSIDLAHDYAAERTSTQSLGMRDGGDIGVVGHRAESARRPAPNPAHAKSLRRREDIVLIERTGLLRECLLRCLADAFDGAVEAVDEPTRLSEGQAGKANLAILSMVDTSGSDVREEVAAALRARPDLSILVLSSLRDVDDVLAALDAGAKGYLSTDMSVQVMIEAVRLVQAGGVYVPSSALEAARMKPAPEQAEEPEMFTARQAAVVEALRRGKANKIIAYELNMCESTVKVHVRNIMKKLKARNRTEAAFLANEMRLRKV